MTELEAKECTKAMMLLFPNADLQAEEVDLFTDTATAYDFHGMKAAIKAVRIKTKFNRPDFGVIFEEARKLAGPRAAQTRKYKTATATAFTTIHPNFYGKSEREVLMRNASMLFWNMAKDEDGNLREDDFVQRYKKVFRRELKAELITAGNTDEHAESYCAWIDSPVRDLDMMINDMGNE